MLEIDTVSVSQHDFLLYFRVRAMEIFGVYIVHSHWEQVGVIYRRMQREAEGSYTHTRTHTLHSKVFVYTHRSPRDKGVPLCDLFCPHTAQQTSFSAKESIWDESVDIKESERSVCTTLVLNISLITEGNGGWINKVILCIINVFQWDISPLNQ